MPKYTLEVNGKRTAIEAAEDMPLLWALRDKAGLTGTKFGCGIGQCGACTVHINGAPVRSCLLPVSSADGSIITTIEGLASSEKLHVLQQVWIDQDVGSAATARRVRLCPQRHFLIVNPTRPMTTSTVRCQETIAGVAPTSGYVKLYTLPLGSITQRRVMSCLLIRR